MGLRRLGAAWMVVAVVATALPVRAEKSRDWSRHVLKVEVTHSDGRRELGSAVPLAQGRMITNCHVLRDAARIRVSTPDAQWPASMSHNDAYRDLCFLDVPGYQGPAVPMATAESARVGMRVLAVGYTGGRFAVNKGWVKGLHTCPCDGGRVIQTSAPFDRGASGGGLFDDKGQLIGILTFKSQAGGDFHFALPVGWLRSLAENRLESLASGSSFWELSGKNSSYFLAACALDARKQWPQLGDLAQEWARQEPDNPEAWMALGRARVGRNLPEAAASAFSRALHLDSTHAGARWELQKLEFELDRPLQDS